MRTSRRSASAGFTLVEMLVVIVIIGILAGFLLPAINAARNKAANAAIAVEITDLEKAVEAYKLKFGDYPPNFSDPALVSRHILKAWPHIQDSEIAVLIEAQSQAGGPIDPAEALVFWLDGFSSDEKRPFTGRGGPFVITGPSTVISANPEREQGVAIFDRGRLTVGDDGDIFPVYIPKGRKAPFVYFDSRTYSFILGGQPAYTIYSTAAMGVAVPSKANRVDPSFNALIDPPDQMLEFAKPKTYQIISAGLDDHYGTGQSLTFNDLPATFPSSPYGGTTLPVFLNAVTKQPFFPHAGFPAQDPRIAADMHYYQIDNITNFSGGGKLEDVEE